MLEIVVAAVLAAGGIRSLSVWSRRRFEGTDVVDHLLYALHVTGRVGTWFTLAGVFVIYGVTSIGRRPTSELGALRWYAVVPIVFTTMQFLAAVSLGRRGRSD